MVSTMFNFLFSLKGRLNRMPFNLFIIPFLIVGYTPYYAPEFVFYLDSVFKKIPVFGLVVCLGIMWSSLAVTVKRLHDFDKSGWFFILLLIPYLGHALVLIPLLIKGTDGLNEYGVDPLD